MKIILGCILCIGLLFAQESENKNVVKTSELELFLFKIGFESLLKDVEITKDKSNLNEEELKKLNDKVELIMNEIYKDKRVLKSDNKAVVINQQVDNREIESLKNEIEFLKSEIKSLKTTSIKQETKISQNSLPIESKEGNITQIIVDDANVRDNPSLKGNIIEVLKKNQKIEIESCDKFDWCKIKGEEKYLSKILLNL